MRCCTRTSASKAFASPVRHNQIEHLILCFGSVNKLAGALHTHFGRRPGACAWPGRLLCSLLPSPSGAMRCLPVVAVTGVWQLTAPLQAPVQHPTTPTHLTDPLPAVPFGSHA